MDDVLSAALNDPPTPAGRDGRDFGVPTLPDRVFLYRSLSALCGAGVPLGDAFGAVADVMSDPVSHEKDGPRIRHYASRAAAALSAEPRARDPSTLGAHLDRIGFVMDDVERCVLALDHRATDPRDLAVALRVALDFALSVQPNLRNRR